MDPHGSARSFLIKPAVSAGIAAAAAALIHPGQNVRLTTGNVVPLPLVWAGAAFLAAEVVALVGDKLFDYMPATLLNIVDQPGHAILNVGVTAGTVALTECVVAPGLSSDVGLVEVLGVGAACEVGATYFTDTWIIPTYNKWRS